ncbi:MAG: hypothetical protein ACRCX2_35930 [Paraclostridium sp.]
MFKLFETDKGNKEEGRSYQDNFYNKSAYNNEFQYCRFCDKHQRFEYDRCCVCNNN